MIPAGSLHWAAVTGLPLSGSPRRCLHTEHRVNFCYITCDWVVTHVRKSSEFQGKFESAKLPKFFLGSALSTYRPPSGQMGSGSRIETGTWKGWVQHFPSLAGARLACVSSRGGWGWLQPPQSPKRQFTSSCCSGDERIKSLVNIPSGKLSFNTWPFILYTPFQVNTPHVLACLYFILSDNVVNASLSALLGCKVLEVGDYTF